LVFILIYWCYLLGITSVYGLVFQRLCKSSSGQPEITLLHGGFIISLIAGIWSIFSGLNGLFEIALISGGVISGGILRKDIFHFFLSLKAKLNALSIILKVILGIIIVFALAQSAGAPYMIDNETYYIQTIKWLDIYGLVPGLANLHFFLSQMSGWHILQSATNLDRLYPHFNDLSSFYLVVGNIYALRHLQIYFKTKHWYTMTIGLFPVFNVFLFQFIGAPSPDIAVYVCFLVILGEYLKYIFGQEEVDKTAMFSIVVFAIFCKLTAILFVIFPIYFLIKSKYSLKRSLPIWGTIGSITLLLFLIKNGLTTGYPLYPFTGMTTFDWQLPDVLHQFYQEQTKLHGFFMTADVYTASSPIERLIAWLRLPKLHGLFNIGMCVLLVLFPILIYRSKLKFKSALWLLYSVSAIQLLLLLISSPQYRYFFMYFMGLFLILAGRVLLKQKRLIYWGISLGTLIVGIPLFIPFNLNVLTTNEFHLSLSTFQWNTIITPHPKTRYTAATFTEFPVENITINTPQNIDFFWATGDGPLPCVQAQQINYFSAYFNVIPRMRGTTFKEGFYSKVITDE